MDLKRIERDARNADIKTFFSSIFGREGFGQLPLNTQRDIIASKYNLTWEQYSKMSVAQRVAMANQAQGHTYVSGVNEGISAAQSDAFWDKTKGFLSGMKFGSMGIAALLVVGGIILFHKPALKQLKKAIQ